MAPRRRRAGAALYRPVRARRWCSTRTSRPTCRTSRTPSRRAVSSGGSVRAASVGGRTITGACSCATRTTTSSRARYDGLGWDWPISYDDIAPYYDKAERLIGVTGKAEGIRSAPDGIFQEPAPLKPHEVLAAAQLRQAGDPRDQRASGSDHGATQRPPAVPLLRPVRPRLRASIELRVELRADLSGDENRAACRC